LLGVGARHKWRYSSVRLNETSRMKRHRPPHIYVDNADYFLTMATYEHHSLFDTDEKKWLLKTALDHAVNTSGYFLHGWVILCSHLHVLIRITLGATLPGFVSRITGKSGIELNKLDGKPGRRVWYQYWDRCVRNESDFYVRLNYIHQNCVKHGYVDDMSLYLFSSYREYVERHGQKWVDECFRMYPVVDFAPEEGLE